MNVEILKNNAGQRVLNVYNTFDPGTVEGNEIDVILIHCRQKETVVELLNKIRLCIGHACCSFFYKPVFIFPELRNRDYYNLLVDGYAEDPDSPLLISRSNEILERIKLLKSYETHVDISNSRVIFMLVLRFYYTRGDKLPTPRLVRNSTLGYSRSLFELFYKNKLITIPETYTYIEELYERDLLKKENFIDKVHVCAQCGHSHLIYRETCPRCETSDLSLNNLIHHFSCANISPENTYMEGELMRCPKCHKILRHIGVDYDRPSDIYSCRVCKISFIQPELNVICVNCGNTCKPEQLRSVDITELRLTASGIKMLVKNNVELMERESVFYKGLTSHRNFTTNLSTQIDFIEINSDANTQTELFVLRIRLLYGEKIPVKTIAAMQEKISYVICYSYLGSQISFFRNCFYLIRMDVQEEVLNREIKKVFTKISEMLNVSFPESVSEIHLKPDYVKYRKEDDKKQFLRNLEIF